MNKLLYHKKCEKTNCMLLTAEATPCATYIKKIYEVFDDLKDPSYMSYIAKNEKPFSD